MAREQRVGGRAVRVDLDHAPVQDPGGDVEVVHGEVDEDSPGGRHVVLRGRLGVVARQANQVELTDRPRGDRLTRRPVARVEAALEADLEQDAGAPDVLQDGVGRRQVERDRLLAEAGEPGLGGQLDQAGVGRRRRGDDQRVDPSSGQVLGGGDAPRADRGGDPPRPLRVRVGHGEPVHQWVLAEDPGVEGPDSTRAGQPDMHARSSSGLLLRGVAQGLPWERSQRAEV